MKIADFFVDLDIKGAAKVKDALSGTKDALQTGADKAWAYKAGIFGAVLAMEEFTRSAVGSAVDLKNFAGATGLSTAELQKWQYIAQMNDVQAEELTTTIKGLQNAQAAMALGKGVPEGALWFGLDPSKNPLEMFDQISAKLRQIGNDQRKIGIARSMAATLGITDQMFAALRTGSMSLAGFRKEMLLTDRERGTLLKLDHTWQQFWWDFKKGRDKIVAEDLAGPITETVHMMTDAMGGMGDLIKVIHRNSKLLYDDTGHISEGFKILGVGLGIALAPLAPYTAALIALSAVLADIHRYNKGDKDTYTGTALSSSTAGTFRNEGVWAGLLRFGGLGPHASEDYNKSAGLPPGTDSRSGYQVMADWLQGMTQAGAPIPAGAAVPGPGGMGPVVNQVTIQVNGAKSPEATAREVGRVLQQLPKGH